MTQERITQTHRHHTTWARAKLNDCYKRVMRPHHTACTSSQWQTERNKNTKKTHRELHNNKFLSHIISDYNNNSTCDVNNNIYKMMLTTISRNYPPNHSFVYPSSAVCLAVWSNRHVCPFWCAFAQCTAFTHAQRSTRHRPQPNETKNQRHRRWQL